MFTDPVGDMIARIRNAYMRSKPFVSVPSSKFKASILEAMQREGYIRGFTLEKDKNQKDSLCVELKYFNGRSVIQAMKRISKPSLHVYQTLKKMTPVANGLGNAIVSTSVGVLSDREARDQHVGGQILLTIR